MPGDSEQAATIWKANVVVVLNASDQDHFAVSGREPYLRACPEWADLRFLTDHDISDTLVSRLETGDVDAVVLGSNALSGAPAQKAVAEPRFADLWKDDGPCSDTGVVVLHQYAQPEDRVSLGFLGNAAFSLVGEQARRVENVDIRFGDEWRFVQETLGPDRANRFLGLSRGYGPKRHCVWTRFDFDHPAEWEWVAWEHTRLPLVAICGGDRSVVACRVPIDVTGEHELLGSLLATCLRPRGSLVVEGPDAQQPSGFTTALASALDRRRFVHRVHPESTDEIDVRESPYHFFGELIVTPEWRVDTIKSLTEAAVLRKLEQGGSIVATFAGPAGSPATVRLSGKPQYAERADRLADWFVPRLAEFQGDVWSMRGLGEVVSAIRAAFEDERQIPSALQATYVRRQLGDRLLARVKHDNVDEIVLATVGAYAALRDLGVTGIGGMHDWAHGHLDGELASVVAHAMTLDFGLRTDKRLERVRAAADRDSAPAHEDLRLLRAYVAILFADSEPQRLAESLADRSLGLGVQAELLRAVTRRDLKPSNDIVETLAAMRARIERLASGNGALEAVCLGNAALIELARKQGIGPSATLRGRSRAADARTIEQTELVRQREVAVKEAEERRSAGRTATTALVALLVFLTVAAIIAIVVWSGGDAGARFGFAAGVLTLMSGFITYVLKRARDAGIPPWGAS